MARAPGGHVGRAQSGGADEGTPLGVLVIFGVTPEPAAGQELLSILIPGNLTVSKHIVAALSDRYIRSCAMECYVF